MTSHIEELRQGILQGQTALSQAILNELAAAGIRVFYLPGQRIHDKNSFLQQAKEAMAFPDYFGNNWDAFEECLRDLSWMPAEEYILVYDHPERFAQADPTQSGIALNILRDAAAFWTEQCPPMRLVLGAEKTLFEE